jgi:hypothetical protein
MDFRPTNVHFAYNQDGSKTRIETWDYDTIAGWELLGNFMNLVLMIFMLALVSPFLLFLAIADFNGRFNVLTPVGAVIGGFVIYDALNGGFLISLLGIFTPEWLMTIVITLNIIAVIGHVYFIFLGILTHKFIVKWYDTEKARINAFVVLMIIIIGCGRLYSESILKDGWMQNNITKNIESIKLEIEEENKQRELKENIDNEVDTKHDEEIISDIPSGVSEGVGGQRPGL